MLFPGFILLISLAVPITRASLMRPSSSQVFFQWGLSERPDLETFFNSKARVVREVVVMDATPAHQLVMGRQDST